jgi:release factor glutamine methyltransferase
LSTLSENGDATQAADSVFRYRLGLSPAQRIQYAHGEVGPNALKAVEEAIVQCEHGLPLAYALGRAEFAGNVFAVNADVLIPRPETEWLIKCAEDYIREDGNQERSLLDLGCGSGCIGLTMAKRFPQLKVTLTDISADALNVARENGRRLGVSQQCDFRSGNW